MKPKILVSSCLLGEPTRYDGKSARYEGVEELAKKYEIISFCPEVRGGLGTPRVPSERVGDGVFMKDGTCVSEQFLLGAKLAYEVCLAEGIKIALLKEKSPSCGKSKIYDGTFSNCLKDGMGVTAEYLTRRGITVFNEKEICKLLNT